MSKSPKDEGRPLDDELEEIIGFCHDEDTGRLFVDFHGVMNLLEEVRNGAIEKDSKDGLEVAIALLEQLGSVIQMGTTESPSGQTH